VPLQSLAAGHGPAPNTLPPVRKGPSAPGSE